MAKYKRMVNCDFVNASSFKLKISNKAKLLYFFILTNADDKGFVDNTDELIELLDSNDRKFHNEASLDLIPNDFSTALNELLEKGLLFEFTDKHNNHIYLIKHWYLHNIIPKARVRDSSYEKYLESAEINDDGEYVVKQMTSKCKANDKQVSAQIKVNKRKENESKENYCEEINNNTLEANNENVIEDNEDEDNYNIPVKWDFEHSSKAVKLLCIQHKGGELTQKQQKYLDAYKSSYENVDTSAHSLNSIDGNDLKDITVEDDDLPF